MSDTEGDAYRRFAMAYGNAWAPTGSEIAAAIVVAKDRQDTDDAPLSDRDALEDAVGHAPNGLTAAIVVRRS